MRIARCLAVGGGLLAAGALPAGAQRGAGDAPVETARVAVHRLTFVATTGEDVGTATLLQTSRGVLVQTDLNLLPPGDHAFHFHETGACEWPSFESAGDNFAGRSRVHGFLARQGPHAGDMPNVHVPGSGVLKVEEYNPNVTLAHGLAPLLDSDGSALVIHTRPDDYRSQPSGDAGSRIACAVISRHSIEE